jgi:hypothetical protein
MGPNVGLCVILNPENEEGPMDELSADLVTKRLSSLEEENRRLHERIDRLTRTQRYWAWFGGLIVVGALLSTGVAGAGYGGEQFLEGERLVIRDPRRGSRRIEMGTQEGKAYLIVCDAEGRPRIVMEVPDNGGPAKMILNDHPL